MLTQDGSELIEVALPLKAINGVCAGARMKVLDAAAWTYVAATLSSILTLLYFLYRAGLLGKRGN